MHRLVRKPNHLAVIVMAAAAIAAGATLSASASAASDNGYTVENLVSDQPGVAETTDPNLVNGWGIAASSTSPWWVSNNGTDTSTLYNGDGVPQPQPTPLVVSVPGAPTGTVFNGGSGFVISDGTNSGAARFLFATEGGTIRGWSPAVPPPPLSSQTFVGPNDADQSGAGAIFKGLAIAGDRLFAADFHNAKVDVFDDSFNLIPGGFVDPGIPHGFAPFGIQNVGGNIFVTYAKQDADAEDEVAGQGLGFVDEYSTDGTLIGRVAQRGHLNAPWGIAMAPDDFGFASGDLLVGNFGDGRINVYEPRGAGTNGHLAFTPKGQLRDEDNNPITIDGLWGIGFGNGAGSGDVDDLYFAAGPDDESHGLFGEISVAADDGD
jgi:uncharacterized protein (TIGR03118 family)